MTDSLAFDRAAGYYDRTRALSPAAMTAIVEMLSGELEGRGRVLEIGVGTGRMALPLAAVGVPLTGVDLSPPMLERLLSKAGGHPPFPLAIADATALPFGDATFGASFAVHVLHLIPGWRDAVHEMSRVVRPGGTVLLDLGGWHGPMEDINDRFFEAAGRRGEHRGLRHEDWDELIAEMTSVGAQPRPLTEIVDERSITPEEVVGALERGEYSQTWDLPDELRRSAAGATRIWAAERFGDLEAPQTIRTPIRWRAFDLPSA